MIRRMNREQLIVVGLVIAAITAVTLGIGRIAVTNHVDWVLPVVAMVAGGGLVVVLNRVGQREGKDKKSGLSVMLVALAGGAVPFFSLLAPTWQLTALGFVDGFLVAFLVLVIERLRKHPYLLSKR